MGDVGWSWNLLRPMRGAGLVAILIRSKLVLIFFLHVCDRPYRVITVIARPPKRKNRRTRYHALTHMANSGCGPSPVTVQVAAGGIQVAYVTRTPGPLARTLPEALRLPPGPQAQATVA